MPLFYLCLFVSDVEFTNRQIAERLCKFFDKNPADYIEVSL
jgi:hypothetical protein